MMVLEVLEVFKNGDELPFSKLLSLVSTIKFLKPSLKAIRIASPIAVAFVMIMSLCLVLWQPGKMVWPYLVFPNKAIPCHLLFLLDFPAVITRRSQFLWKQSWIECLLWWSLIWWSLLGSNATIVASLNLYIKDLAISIVSKGLGCLPSKMTWFLWNHMHQSVVMTLGRVSKKLNWGAELRKRSWIHCVTVICCIIRFLVLMSIPNQTALAKLHWRNRWSMDSSSQLQRQHVVSQGIPLLFISSFTGIALLRIFQVKSKTLWGSLIFQSRFQSLWLCTPSSGGP